MPQRPPKDWWDRCVKSVTKSQRKSGGTIDPAKICGATWYKRMSPEVRDEILRAVEKINGRAKRAKAEKKPAAKAKRKPAARRPSARRPSAKPRKPRAIWAH